MFQPQTQAFRPSPQSAEQPYARSGVVYGDTIRARVLHTPDGSTFFGVYYNASALCSTRDSFGSEVEAIAAIDAYFAEVAQ